jgi:hypothetical protein
MSKILEDLELCPMCGHEGFTQEGCCANCGEPLFDTSEFDEPDPEPKSQPHWPIAFGAILLITFGVLSLLMIVEAIDEHGRARTEALLYAAAMACVSLIGLNVFVRGIIAAIRQSE